MGCSFYALRWDVLFQPRLFRSIHAYYGKLRMLIGFSQRYFQLAWSYLVVHIITKSTENFLFVTCMSVAVLPKNILPLDLTIYVAFFWDWARERVSLKGSTVWTQLLTG